MNFLLDTCAVSDYFKRVGATHARFQAHPPYQLAISTITEHEMRFGLGLKPGATRLAASIRSFLQLIEILPFDREDALASAEIRARLYQAGKPIGDFDVLIAGVALARNLILVTANEAEFARVPGLVVENWRS